MSTGNKTDQEQKEQPESCDMRCCPTEGMAKMMSMCCGSTAKGENPKAAATMAKCCESAANCCTTDKEK